MCVNVRVCMRVEGDPNSRRRTRKESAGEKGVMNTACGGGYTHTHTHTHAHTHTHTHTNTRTHIYAASKKDQVEHFVGHFFCALISNCQPLGQAEAASTKAGGQAAPRGKWIT